MCVFLNTCTKILMVAASFVKLLHLVSVLNQRTLAASDSFSLCCISMKHEVYVWMLALHSLILSKSLILSIFFSELIASMTKVCGNPLDFALASLAQLSLVRSTAVSISVKYSSNFVESCLLKMAMSWRREFVRFICFCAVHSVSVYWYTTSLNGVVGVGAEAGCVLSVRERVCSSCSRWSMQSNPSAGWPSQASTHCHKLCISLAAMFKSAWLFSRRSLRQSSAFYPLKAIIVSELSAHALSSTFLTSSTWQSRSLSACPALPCWVVIALVLYVAQYDWYLFPIFLRMVLSGGHTHLLLLLWHSVICRVCIWK